MTARSTGAARSTGTARICGILNALAIGIVTEGTGETSEAGTHVATRIAADLLQSSAESAVQDEGFVGAFTFYAGGKVGRFRRR